MMDMDMLKACLAVIIVSSQVAGFLSGGVPYYPIELSRMMASNPASLYTFRLGVTCLALALDSPPTATKVMLWLALMLIAWLPDNVYFWGHVAGVGFILMTAIAHTLLCPGRRLINLLLIASAVVIYALRFVLKFGILYYFVKNKTDIAEYVMLTRTVMFDGPDAHRPGEFWDAVLPIFRLCGVLQWISLGVLSFVF